MKKLTALITDNRVFFTGYILFVLCFTSLLIFLSKAEGFLLLNHYDHYKMLTWFFNIYTNVGDGLFSVAVFILLLVISRRLLAVEVIIAFALSGIVSQICKRIFSTPRPKAFFLEQHINYPYIDSITLAGHTSFPSGHTISAFALATILSFNTKNKWLAMFYLAAAILVGYSRIYLGVHFPEDVLGGSVIGVVTALLVHYFFISRRNVKSQ